MTTTNEDIKKPEDKKDALLDRLNKLKEFLNLPEKKVSFEDNYLRLFLSQNNDLGLSFIVDFFMTASLYGAHPAKKQIYLTKRYDKKREMYVGVTVFSYHFMLDRANQTGEMGQLTCTSEVEKVFDPIKGEWVEMLVATATVERKGRGPTTYKARWDYCYDEYSQFWKNDPYKQLEKTAIANVLRWAFPEVLSGIYLDSETKMFHVEQEGETNQERTQKVTALLTEAPLPEPSMVGADKKLVKDITGSKGKGKKQTVEA